MGKYSKWIGGALGFALVGPIGAITGFVLGSLIDSATERKEPIEGGSGRTQPGDFAMSMVILSAAVMKADGRVMKSELDFVKAFYKKHFGEEKTKELIGVMKEVLEHDVSVRQVCLQIRHNMNHPMRLQLLHFLFGIANADGAISSPEHHLLNTIARYLGISQKDFYSIEAMFGIRGSSRSYHSYSQSSGGYSSSPRRGGMAADQAYRILEIDSSVSADDLKKAYRRMAKKHHPDRVANLGPEFQKDAKEKFQKIQEAYETIKQLKGIN